MQAARAVWLHFCLRLVPSHQIWGKKACAGHGATATVLADFVWCCSWKCRGISTTLCPFPAASFPRRVVCMCGVDAQRALGKGFPEDSSAPGLRKHVQRWDGRWGTPSRAAMSAPQNMVPSHGGAAAACWGLDLGLSWHRAQWG